MLFTAVASRQRRRKGAQLCSRLGNPPANNRSFRILYRLYTVYCTHSSGEVVMLAWSVHALYQCTVHTLQNRLWCLLGLNTVYRHSSEQVVVLAWSVNCTSEQYCTHTLQNRLCCLLALYTVHSVYSVLYTLFRTGCDD